MLIVNLTCLFRIEMKSKNVNIFKLVLRGAASNKDSLDEKQ